MLTLTTLVRHLVYYNMFHVVVVVILVIIMVLRKRGKGDRKDQDDSGDPWDDKHHFKYDVKRAADDLTHKHLKQNDTGKEFAQGTVSNPVYKIGGTVIDNPTYLVSYSM